MSGMMILQQVFHNFIHRFKFVKRRKTKATIQNNTSGEVHVNVSFEEELADIEASDESMVPLVLRGQGKVQ
jgi:2-succinyl-5-enolpyruvyl-6-hydroxy-3-cyclohexene-1-carboxylate synthase